MTLKTAIIGCGKVGHFHAKAYEQLENSTFCAVFDRDLSRAKDFAEQYGVKAYDDISEMIKNEGINVVSVCTPHPVHAEVAIEAANAGCHILVEKPLASNLKDCDAILGAASKTNVKVGTVCQRRFYRPCLRIKKAIDDGKLGRPVLGTVTMLGWRDKAYYDSDPWRGTWDGEGGGVLVNQAPHQLDLLLWYMGDVEEVYGLWRNLNHPYIEVEDTAVAVIKFKNGGIGNILVSNSQNPALYGKVQVYGENGASVGVQTDGGAMFIAGVSSITEPPYNDQWTVQGEESLLSGWQQEDRDFFNSQDSMYYYHQLQINDFLTSITESRPSLIDGLAGRKTVELIEAIYRSTESGLPVKFPLK
ncbi:Glucose--fructose oxidoreductase precursor [Leminorella richardii]|uniref:Glucose--fructose oxidoreductase n=1 Tax=Leminorella richardii TaxID=158841 RepID=A0A2X4VFX7_9GAMM|nr:Gfo/Idh/MocA family oxidoreductase [Leminorella richardii]SQI44220.1 Glucose--fructose oxidoreductase precursor [Leminorella richardii]